MARDGLAGGSSEGKRLLGNNFLSVCGKTTFDRSRWSRPHGNALQGHTLLAAHRACTRMTSESTTGADYVC